MYLVILWPFFRLFLGDDDDLAFDFVMICFSALFVRLFVRLIALGCKLRVLFESKEGCLAHEDGGVPVQHRRDPLKDGRGREKIPSILKKRTWKEV